MQLRLQPQEAPGTEARLQDLPADQSEGEEEEDGEGDEDGSALEASELELSDSGEARVSLTALGSPP